MPSDHLTARRRELQRQSSGLCALHRLQLEKATGRSRMGNA